MTDMEIDRLEDAARRVFGHTEPTDEQPAGRERPWLSRTVSHVWSACTQHPAKARHPCSTS